MSIRDEAALISNFGSIEVVKLMKYEIEYAQFTKIVVEAENESEANDIAAIMDGEDIAEYDPHEYAIWNVTPLT